MFDPALLAQDPPFLAVLSLPQMVPLAVVIVEQDQASPLYPAPNQIGLSTFMIHPVPLAQDPPFPAALSLTQMVPSAIMIVA